MQTVNDISNKPAGLPLRYLALGDSYTIAESIELLHSFPYQLAALLDSQGWNVGAPQIIAKTGWTTDNLLDALKNTTLQHQFDMVTLLIGVNNQYKGHSLLHYRKEFKALLQTAIAFAGGNKTQVFVLSIPDWGTTPFGRQSGRAGEQIAKEIDAFNALNLEETNHAGVSYTDITPVSRSLASTTKMLATDGLHPSGFMYSEWVKLLLPSVLKAFK